MSSLKSQENAQWKANDCQNLRTITERIDIALFEQG